MKPYQWKTTDDRIVLELWPTDTPAKEIARRIGCAAPTLTKAARRLGLGPKKPPDLLQRVRMRCDIEGDQVLSCWIWRGYVDPTGTPKINTDGKPKNARRVAMEALNRWKKGARSCGAVCGEPLCVNPHHGIARTAREHVRYQFAIGALGNAAHIAATNRARLARAKVGPQRAEQIRAMQPDAAQKRQLATEIGCTVDAINRVLGMRTYLPEVVRQLRAAK